MELYHRRKALALLAGSAASLAAGPTLAGSDHVTLQLVGMRFHQGVHKWLGGAGRPRRVLDTGPRMFKGLAQKRYKPVKRQIPLNVFFWMNAGYQHAAPVRSFVQSGYVAEERVSRFWYAGRKLRSDISEASAPFVRGFNSLPFATQGSLSGSPVFAVSTSLTGFALGWRLDRGFLSWCSGIMICPRADTVWPRRQGGAREGLIITAEEIRRWNAGGFKTPTAGLMDSV